MKVLGQQLQKKDLIHIIPRLIIVIIIGQTLPFKFTGADESVWIFDQMGWEPWGRYLIALIETTAIILLLSRWYIAGSIITLSIISAANFMHFTRLGFVINDDGGVLFISSIIVIVCSLIVVIHWNRKRRKDHLPNLEYEVMVDEEIDEDRD
ncbi:MAG: hypothetical protein Tsb0034_24110 [Ekhidna sp.]